VRKTALDKGLRFSEVSVNGISVAY